MKTKLSDQEKKDIREAQAEAKKIFNDKNYLMKNSKEFSKFMIKTKITVLILMNIFLFFKI